MTLKAFIYSKEMGIDLPLCEMVILSNGKIKEVKAFYFDTENDEFEYFIYQYEYIKKNKIKFKKPEYYVCLESHVLHLKVITEKIHEEIDVGKVLVMYGKESKDYVEALEFVIGLLEAKG